MMQIRIERYPRALFTLDFDDFDALVAATRGTNLVGQAHFVAFGTRHQVSGLQRVVTAPAPLPAFAQFAFW
jgi:hypothetical protein